MTSRLHRIACALEQLEQRRLLSAVIVHRTLRIIGTGHDDQIDLETDGAITTVALGDKHVRAFANVDYDAIVIEAKTGNDAVRISDDLTKPSTIDGGDGDDCLKGGGGDDVIRPGLGNDTLEGGGTAHEPGGVNTADYSDRTEALTLVGSKLTTASGEQDLLELGSSLQRLLTGSGDDSLDVRANYEGDTTFVDAGAGNDYVLLSMGGYVGDGTVHGGAGDDYILITGRRGLCYGDAGDDTFAVARSRTAREFFGGPGIDTADYSGGSVSYYPIIVTFDDQPNDGAPVEYAWAPSPDNVHTDVERLVGPRMGSKVYGSNNDETIIGSSGVDSLVGGGGNDFLESQITSFASPRNTLIGGTGDDTLIGGPGNDLLDGGEGNDSLVGNDGDDTLIGGPGDDVLDGGAGNNTIIDDARAARIFTGELLDELGNASNLVLDTGGVP